MAMNKKEQAEIEMLKTKLALHFYPAIEPDLDIPGYDDGIVNGWTYNVYSMRVEKACTSYAYHGIGLWDKTNSQGLMRLYSTKELAYKALLAKMALKYANELRDVEKKMEAEIADEED